MFLVSTIEGTADAIEAYENMQEHFDNMEESVLNCDIDGYQQAQSGAWNEAVNFTAEVAGTTPNTILTGPASRPRYLLDPKIKPTIRPKPFKPPSRPGFERVSGYFRTDGTYVAPYYRRPSGNTSNAPYTNNNQYPRK